jgi:lysophospholipase L1-like esterase
VPATVVHTFATVLLAPLLLYQGRRVRKQVPLLPEPPSDRIGTKGTGPELRLLVVGDSAAAGVGAESQQEALLGQIVKGLASGFTVRWRLHAVTGATTASTIDRLQHIETSTCDVVVTSLGVNDVTAQVGRANWLNQQNSLRTKLVELFQPKLIVFSGFPPVHAFPALPQPLRWYLGRRSQELDRDLEREVNDVAGISYVPLDFAHGPQFMASDGFHPGPPAYTLWAKRVAEVILRNMTKLGDSSHRVADEEQPAPSADLG